MEAEAATEPDETRRLTAFELRFSRIENRPPTLAELEALLAYVRKQADAQGWDLLDPLPGSEEYRLVKRKQTP